MDFSSSPTDSPTMSYGPSPLEFRLQCNTMVSPLDCSFSPTDYNDFNSPASPVECKGFQFLSNGLQ